MFKPMLAGKAPADLANLRYPVLASPKLDGIRCIIRDGMAVSRNLKPIPNEYVRAALEGLPDGIDGELMVEGGFSACSSFFMSKDKESPDFWFFAFDWSGVNDARRKAPFALRLRCLTEWSEQHGHNNLHVVEHVEIHNAEDLAAYEAQCLSEGFEGVMVRDPEGEYKFGRSTTREGGLLKIKQFVDEEAEVIELVERMHNENEATLDVFGRTERSTAKDGKRPAGDMGALRCRTADGAEFQIGTGFTAEERVVMWNKRAELVGRLVKFKHQPDPGGRLEGQAPRFPVYLGFRDTADLS
jgi:DNA ligase-1